MQFTRIRIPTIAKIRCWYDIYRIGDKTASYWDLNL